MPVNVWTRVLKNVEGRINLGSFNTWFKPTSFLSIDEGTLKVQVPSQVFKDWLDSNYGELVNDACQASGLARVAVQYVVRPEEASPLPPATAPRRAATAGPAGVRGRPLDSLNPKYSFESFVVGPFNQFAHAAARAVAQGASIVYNPLFLYGGVGLGKTHLMHAIGHELRRQRPGVTLVYLSAETFMNELVNAIRYDHTHEFREKYRNVDVLLVDDIQFLAGKERTQEEFFHTFNALYDAQKQIVISSDRTPKDIPTLEERLQSRFEWGLIADIQPPDLETTIAILKRKADDENLHLPDEVAMFMASQLQSNIREIEGAIIRLLAFSSMSSRTLDLALAKEVLSGILARRNGAVELERILQAVADRHCLRPQDLLSRSNAHAVAHPRQIAMYLAKKMTGMSFPQIGKAFGGKHHTTVLHSVRKVEEALDQDEDMRRLVQSITETLQ